MNTSARHLSRILCLVFIALFGWTGQQDEGAYRTWTSNDNKYNTVAELISADATSAKLRQKSGAIRDVPLDRLSKADRLFVAEFLTGTIDPNSMYVGKVVGVTDGDSLTLLIANRQYKVRLYGIDAPESGQDFGQKSKQHLSGLIFGKDITVVGKGNDKYGRYLGVPHIDDKRVDEEMVKSGMAWHYKEYAPEEHRLADLERAARLEKVGLWSESGPLPPWTFRRMTPEEHQARAKTIKAQQSRTPTQFSVTPPTNNDEIRKDDDRKDENPKLSHWLNTGSSVRHNASCRWYRNTKNGRDCGPNEGRGCKICGG